MKKFILLFLCLLSMGLFSQEKDFKTVPVDKFVTALRSAGTGETWGRLSGTIAHRRRGSRPVEAPLSFRTLFTAKAVVGQLVFREKELYQLTQSRVAPFSSSVPQTNSLQSSRCSSVRSLIEDLGSSFKAVSRLSLAMIMDRNTQL